MLLPLCLSIKAEKEEKSFFLGKDISVFSSSSIVMTENEEEEKEIALALRAVISFLTNKKEERETPLCSSFLATEGGGEGEEGGYILFFPFDHDGKIRAPY